MTKFNKSIGGILVACFYFCPVFVYAKNKPGQIVAPPRGYGGGMKGGAAGYIVLDGDLLRRGDSAVAELAVAVQTPSPHAIADCKSVACATKNRGRPVITKSKGNRPSGKSSVTGVESGLRSIIAVSGTGCGRPIALLPRLRGMEKFRADDLSDPGSIAPGSETSPLPVKKRRTRAVFA